jgi:hypothetical protein
MGMTARLYSLNALATELNRDRRTLGRALARVRPDGQTDAGDPAWYLTTALRALGEDHQRHDGYDDGIAAVEYAARQVNELLERLRAEPNIGKRRKMLQRGEGAVVGEFTQAVERVRSVHSEVRRLVEEPYVLKMYGDMISEVLALCHWQLEAS